MPIDKFQELTNRIIELMEKGVKPWEKPWHSLNFQNLISGHEYRGWNPLICSVDMALYGYSQPFFVGFAQAKAQNWQVKKGSKSTWLKYASVGVKESENEGEDPQTFRFSKWLQVFNVDCLDDSKSDQKIQDTIVQKKPVNPPTIEDRIQKIEEFIQSHKPTIGYGGSEACYVPSADKI